MQRSFSYQDNIVFFFSVCALFLYESMAAIYPILPLFFSIFYFYLAKYIDNSNYYKASLILLLLLYLENINHYFFTSTILYFFIIKLLILPKIEQLIECHKCQLIIYVVFVYLGFYLFNLVIAKIFLLEGIVIDLHIVYYIIIEFFVLSLL